MKLILCQNEKQLVTACNIFSETYRQTSLKDFKKKYSNDEIYLIDFENKIVGWVLLSKRNELGYFILKEYRRRGMAKKAVQKLMKLAKREYYWALMSKENDSSMLFIQSLGFVPRGYVYGKNVRYCNKCGGFVENDLSVSCRRCYDKKELD